MSPDNLVKQMIIEKINDYVGIISAKDWNKTLFDALIPLPDGTTYNSYIIKAKEKTVLIDTVDTDMANQFIDTLKYNNIEKIDYIVVNHAEQEHLGALPLVLKKFPEAMIITNESCKNLLESHLEIDKDKFIVISDGDSFPIGNKTLKFIKNDSI